MRKAAAAGRSVMRLACLVAATALIGVAVVAGVYEQRNREAHADHVEHQDEFDEDREPPPPPPPVPQW